MKILNIRQVDSFYHLNFLREKVKRGYYFEKDSSFWIVVLRIGDIVIAKYLYSRKV